MGRAVSGITEFAPLIRPFDGDLNVGRGRTEFAVRDSATVGDDL